MDGTLCFLEGAEWIGGIDTYVNSMREVLQRVYKRYQESLSNCKGYVIWQLSVCSENIRKHIKNNKSPVFMQPKLSAKEVPCSRIRLGIAFMSLKTSNPLWNTCPPQGAVQSNATRRRRRLRLLLLFQGGAKATPWTRTDGIQDTQIMPDESPGHSQVDAS